MDAVAQAARWRTRAITGRPEPARMARTASATGSHRSSLFDRHRLRPGTDSGATVARVLTAIAAKHRTTGVEWQQCTPSRSIATPRRATASGLGRTRVSCICSRDPAGFFKLDRSPSLSQALRKRRQRWAMAPGAVGHRCAKLRKQLGNLATNTASQKRLHAGRKARLKVRTHSHKTFLLPISKTYDCIQLTRDARMADPQLQRRAVPGSATQINVVLRKNLLGLRLSNDDP